MPFIDKAVQARKAKLDRLAAGLRHPRQIVEDAGRRLSERAERLIRAAQTITPDKARTLTATVRVLDSLSFERVLDRGFVVVRDANGLPVSHADALTKDTDITLEFRDKKHRTATVKD
jgi:exodeoxyribonuclease VII large subunit